MGFRRRRRNDEEMAGPLRASLQHHARQAPRGEHLAERILAAVDEPAPEHHRVPPRRRFAAGWALPAIAAASVAAVAAIAVGIAHVSTGTDQATPPGHRFGATNKPTGSARNLTTNPASTSPGVPAPTGGHGDLEHVRVLDLTFAGTDDGWALASAHCLNAEGRCTAVLRTHDGQTWTSMGGENFNVPGVQGCKYPCVEHLRFATDEVGYAFGPSAFFMTTDGGRSWHQQPGGAIALETFDNDVVRVTARSSGCPMWCGTRVEVAPVGGTAWSSVTLPGSTPNGLGMWGLELGRGGTDVYLLSLRHSAGGAGIATSTLYRSADDGMDWQKLREPCPQRGGENDSYAIAAGAQDDVSALCLHRAGNGMPEFVVTSTNAGDAFVTRSALPLSASLLAGDPHTVLVAAGRAGLARSTDGGATWATVDEPFGDVTFVGFENTTVGRVIADNGATIWTTRDAGRTWHRATLR